MKHQGQLVYQNWKNIDSNCIHLFFKTTMKDPEHNKLHCLFRPDPSYGSLHEKHIIPTNVKMEWCKSSFFMAYTSQLPIGVWP